MKSTDQMLKTLDSLDTGPVPLCQCQAARLGTSRSLTLSRRAPRLCLQAPFSERH